MDQSYNTQNTVTLFILILVSIVTMTVDQRFNYLETTRSTLSHILYPIRYIVNLPSEMIDWGQENLSSRDNLLKENKELKSGNFALKSELQKYAILERENQRLRTLFHSAKKVKNKILIAELLSVDLDPYRQQIMINQGENQDTYIGQALVDADGIVGQIIHTDSYSSTALLISDPNHAIPVRIDRTGLRTIALGTGNPDQLKLAYIPKNSDIIIGDLIVSSGLGGRFPANYPVGIITDIAHSPGKAFSTILAKPSAHLNQTHEVLLVWHNQPKADEANE